MDALPEEMIIFILSLVGERTLREVVPFVCKRWAELAKLRSTWKNTIVSLDGSEEADFAERRSFAPPSVHTLILSKSLELSEDDWRVVFNNTTRVRCLYGLSGELKNTLTVLNKCRNCLRELSVDLTGAYDKNFWHLLSSLPQLQSLQLKGQEGSCYCPPEVIDGNAWPRLEKLDISQTGKVSGSVELFKVILNLRKHFIRTLILSVEIPLTSKLAFDLKTMCPNLKELGLSTEANVTWLDNMTSLERVTLIGNARRETLAWLRRSPVMAKVSVLRLEGLRDLGSIYRLLPAAGRACKSLRKLTLRHCQLDPDFPSYFKGCPLLELHCENVLAEHIHRIRQLPRLTYLQLSGHLGNFKSTMAAVEQLKMANPNLRISGLEDCLFNHYTKSVSRVFL